MWLFGCLGLILVLAVGALVGTWIVVNRVKSAVEQEIGADGVAAFREGAGAVRDAQRQAERSRQTARERNRHAFTPPEDGALTAGQLDRFLRIQDRIMAEMGDDFEAFEQRWREVIYGDEANRDGGTFARFIMERGRMEVRRQGIREEAQVTVEMSDREYSWIQERVVRGYAAAYVQQTEGRELTEREQALAVVFTPIGMQATDNEIALVEPHMDRLRLMPRQLFMLDMLGQ